LITPYIILGRERISGRAKVNGFYYPSLKFNSNLLKGHFDADKEEEDIIVFFSFDRHQVGLLFPATGGDPALRDKQPDMPSGTKVERRRCTFKQKDFLV
jgi:hypothetical protein